MDLKSVIYMQNFLPFSYNTGGPWTGGDFGIPWGTLCIVMRGPCSSDMLSELLGVGQASKTSTSGLSRDGQPRLYKANHLGNSGAGPVPWSYWDLYTTLR